VSALTANLHRAAQASTKLKAPAGASAEAGGAGGVASGAAGLGIGAMALRAMPGIGAGVGGAVAVKSATGAALSFEKAMAGVAAVGEIDRASAAFARLTRAAKEGSQQFNSIQKAEGLRELVAAGMSAEQAADSLNNTLQLATAGEISMSRAAEIMVASMSTFKFEAKDTAIIVDTLTAAANASPASIEDMGEAMKFVAPVANALKISISDASAALAILANNGVRGGLAGRGLGAVFARIIAPSKDAAEAIERQGVALKDLNPTIAGMQSALENMARLDQETLVKVFGAENLDVSNILASNAEGFASMATAMENAKGAGDRFAQTIANTGAGEILRMKNAFTELGIVIGEIAAGPLTSFAKAASDGINTVGSLMKAAKMQIHPHLAARERGEERIGQIRSAIDRGTTPEAIRNAIALADEVQAKVQAQFDRLQRDIAGGEKAPAIIKTAEELRRILGEIMALNWEATKKGLDLEHAQSFTKEVEKAGNALARVWNQLKKFSETPVGPQMTPEQAEDAAEWARKHSMDALDKEFEESEKKKKQKPPDIGGVADSLQSLGGGGGLFTGGGGFLGAKDTGAANVRATEGVKDEITKAVRVLDRIDQNTSNRNTGGGIIRVRAA
jgi:TP901 family phage tail tape measure protein